MTESSAPRVRSTRQRVAVAGVLDELEGFRSAQQIHAVLVARGDAVGLSTVYRTLQAMAAADEVDSLLTDDGESVYRRCAAPAHHHHLVCRQCGATVEVDGPAVESWADRIAADHGYDEVSHTLEIFGRCGSCRAGER
jgi:Fur family ferric uptake transcriptional regulator